MDDILKQEGLLWYQQSREDWIVSRDRNTKFYHASTLVRKSRNIIRALRSTMGDWITDQNQLEQMAHEFYKNIFQEEVLSRPENNPGGNFQCISQEQFQKLKQPFTPDEIKRATFDMAPFKAPIGKEQNFRNFNYSIIPNFSRFFSPLL